MLPWRLLDDPAAAGSWNMAVDEALLQSAAATGRGTLRFYRWSEPTLSLGYFQRLADRATHAASRDCPLVRRASGGGAIVHDRELTYSLIIPRSAAIAADAAGLYDAVHRGLLDALRGWSISAEINAVGAGLLAAAEPFLCFQRRAVGDVLLGRDKVAGSAQRRHAGAILQHGSVLLASSIAAPELPGLCELSGRRVTPAELLAAWLPTLSNRLAIVPEAGALSPAEHTAAVEIERTRFTSETWNAKR